MADISQTAANVRPYEGATIRLVTAATTVAAGNLVYQDTTDDNKFRPADASAAASAILYGIALTNSSDGLGLVVQTGGDVDPGGTVAAGTIYTASTAAGGIQPSVDNSSESYYSTFGRGITSTKLHIGISNTSTAHA